MTHIEAIKQMVHELEYVLDCINNDKIPFDGDDFHEALRLGRQAIAEAEKQEPVAWEVYVEEADNSYLVDSLDDPQLIDDCTNHNAVVTPLYTHPQPKAEQTSCYCPNCEALSKKLAEQEPKCNPHPKAPHGFNRNASHANDRYVCECEGWDAYEAGYEAGYKNGMEDA